MQRSVLTSLKSRLKMPMLSWRTSRDVELMPRREQKSMKNRCLRLRLDGLSRKGEWLKLKPKTTNRSKLQLKLRGKLSTSRRRISLQRLWLPNMRSSSRKGNMRANFSSQRPSESRNLISIKWFQSNSSSLRTILPGLYSLRLSRRSLGIPMILLLFLLSLKVAKARSLSIWMKLH